MEKAISLEKKYGLIGQSIDYSFSKKYFTEKFERENIKASYQNFDCHNISEVENTLTQVEVSGFNVTIPYKQTIMPLLDVITKTAMEIGAVNCVEIDPDGKKIGHNTDWIGFKKSIEPWIKEHHQHALILGTGGASKAVKFALEKLGVSTCLVSRNKKENHWIYSELNADILKKNLIIINTTPLGTSPNINESPKIPFEYITPEHLVFDLIYNPAETLLMKKAKFQGAQTLNGYEMLCLQAEAGWKIWSKQPETTE